MASSEQENLPTPENVAEIATKKAQLDRIALIGVFGSEMDPSALVRESNGTIIRVTTGDHFNGGVVAAIGLDDLVLVRRGRTKLLKLPQV